MAGIYIHIPFCSQFCTYCDFYSVKAGKRVSKFTEALLLESGTRSCFFNGISDRNNTLYFGGGTPSLITPEVIAEIAHIVCSDNGLGNVGDLDEFTVEVNPDDVTEEYLRGLYHAGVRRLSMGIQSFKDTHLKWMNRRHTSDAAVKAYNIAREVGFDNISIDLIFGFDRLSAEDWSDNLKTAISLRPDHISSYQLSIEPGTKLGADYEKGDYKPLEDDVSHFQYSTLQTTLAEAGYVQYEVSSFALKGREAKHNSSYWNHTPYLGLGPAAHSFDGVRRYANRPSLGAYIKRYSAEGIALSLTQGYREGYITTEVLTENDLFNESLMLSLRRVEGLNLTVLLDKFKSVDRDSFLNEINFLVEKGELQRDGGNIKIPSGKLFLSDGIIRVLFR